MTRRFIGYPVDRLLAVIDDPAVAARVASDLAAAGLPTRDITLLRGAEGADRLDGTGARNGPTARLRRVVDFAVADQLVDMAWYEQAVRDGKVVVMVRVRGDDPRQTTLEVLASPRCALHQPLRALRHRGDRALARPGAGRRERPQALISSRPGRGSPGPPVRPR